MPQSDIEIYVKCISIDSIITWLESVGDKSSEINQEGRSYTLTLTINNKLIPITIVEGAAGKAWTSLWFNSTETPWGSDVDCARACYLALNCQVRCNGAFWQDNSASMDEWWQITENGDERLIEWA
ncbi:MAG: hypothetical protein KAG53_02080 [Endozoicomonadaceae bacterium]|nr:hypothetical protein [Endozoicomonadaceae bacterium]